MSNNISGSADNWIDKFNQVNDTNKGIEVNTLTDEINNLSSCREELLKKYNLKQDKCIYDSIILLDNIILNLEINYDNCICKVQKQ